MRSNLTADYYIFYWKQFYTVYIILKTILSLNTYCSLFSFSGHSGRSFWCHSVICRWDVRRAHVVTRADSQRHLQPGFLRQPPQRRCHCLVWHGSGASRRRLQLSLWPLSLKGCNTSEGLQCINGARTKQNPYDFQLFFRMITPPNSASMPSFKHYQWLFLKNKQI